MHHQEDQRIGAIVDMQEVAARRAGPPHHDLGRTGILCLGYLGDQRRDDMRGFEVEIVVRAVEVRRHCGDEV
ncbi:hypothetical protein D3C83_75490 [compost metagenome]